MFGMTAESIGTVLTGLGFALIALLGGKSIRNKTASGAREDGQVLELAGAVIDHKQAKQIVEGLAALEARVHAHERALDRNTEACEDMGDIIKRSGEHMSALANRLEVNTLMGRMK
jgi:hypothetical protein